MTLEDVEDMWHDELERRADEEAARKAMGGAGGRGESGRGKRSAPKPKPEKSREPEEAVEMLDEMLAELIVLQAHKGSKDGLAKDKKIPPETWRSTTGACRAPHPPRCLCPLAAALIGSEPAHLRPTPSATAQRERSPTAHPIDWCARPVPFCAAVDILKLVDRFTAPTDGSADDLAVAQDFHAAVGLEFSKVLRCRTATVKPIEIDAFGFAEKGRGASAAKFVPFPNVNAFRRHVAQYADAHPHTTHARPRACPMCTRPHTAPPPSAITPSCMLGSR
jgi:hypothetical protein